MSLSSRAQAHLLRQPYRKKHNIEMNYTTLDLGGKKRPVRFSFSALYEYEKQTGRNAIADFSKMNASGGVSVTVVADLIFAGLVVAHQSAGVAVDFTAHDVADWVFSEDGVVDRFTQVFTDSFSQKPNLDKSKKKAGTRPLGMS